LFDFTAGTLFLPENVLGSRTFAYPAAKAGIAASSNAPRASYAVYRYAQSRNAAQVAAEMGLEPPQGRDRNSLFGSLAESAAAWFAA
jgi:hypothetical protein